MTDIPKQIEALAETVARLGPEGRKSGAKLVRLADEWRKSNEH